MKTNLFALLALALIVTSLLTTPACGSTRYWNGESSSLWSDPNNWDPHVTPHNGDDLVFSTKFFGGSPDRDSVVNDFTNLTVKSLTFENHDYQLSGNSLTITAPAGVAIQNTVGGFGSSWTVTINCPLVLPNGGAMVSGDNFGMFTENTTELRLNGPIEVGSGTLILTAASSQLDGEGNVRVYVSGVVSGFGDVVAELTGNKDDSFIQFDGPQGNTFTGTLYVATDGVGQVVFNKQSGVVVNSFLRVDNHIANQLVLNHANQFASAATVEVLYGSRLLLSGIGLTIGNLVLVNDTFDIAPAVLDSGGTTVTLLGNLSSDCFNGSVVPALKGKLNLDVGTHDFNITGNVYAGLDLQAQIVGSAGFFKYGSAALLIEASNTFSGNISVFSGILDVRNNNALGDAVGDTRLFGGSLTLRNVAIGTKKLLAEGQGVAGEMPGSLLTSVGACSWAGQVQLDTNLVVTGDMIFTGPISGTGGIGFFGGTSQLGGTAANLYTGTTLVRGPLVTFNKPSFVNAFFGPLVVGGGAGGTCEARWLNSYQNLGTIVTIYDNGIINLNNFSENVGSITFNGGLVQTGTGQFGINQFLAANPANTIAVINGFLRLPSPSTPVNFYIADGAADPDLQVNAVVVATAPVVKQGLGTMSFTGINTYTGTTTVNQGILEVNNNAALGNSNVGTIVQSNATLRCAGSGTMAEAFTINGAGAAGANGALEVVANGSFTLNGNVSLASASTIGVGQSAGLGINSVISGTGPLTKSGSGILVLSGASGNTYSGDTIVSAGTLSLSKPQFVIAVPGNLVLGPAPLTSPAVAVFFQTGEMGGDTVTVNANSILNLNGNNQGLSRLNLNDGGSAQTGVGVLGFSDGGNVVVGSQSIFGSRAGSTITGKIGFPDNGGVTFTVGLYSSFPPIPTAPELDVPAIISGSSSLFFNGLIKEGSGQMRLGANNTFPGQVRINEGRLRVDGAQPQSQVVVNSGTLGGTGTVGRVIINGSSAVVAPGSSPGILTCSNFNAGATGPGTLQMELNGTTPGSGYDQLNVHGTVTLTGVALSASLNFASSVNNQFTLINNDNADAVIGTFNGLSQNAALYIGGEQFFINYNGGTGNDVVLTRIATPPKPVLTIQNLPPASVRLLWPTNDPSFSLQFNTNLTTTNWASASPPPVILGTNNVVTNATGGAQKYYRLFKP